MSKRISVVCVHLLKVCAKGKPSWVYKFLCRPFFIYSFYSTHFGSARLYNCTWEYSLSTQFYSHIRGLWCTCCKGCTVYFGMPFGDSRTPRKVYFQICKTSSSTWPPKEQAQSRLPAKGVFCCGCTSMYLQYIRGRHD